MRTPQDSGSNGVQPGGLTGVGLSSLIAAASGYLVLFIAARSLDKAENASFLAYWAALFFVIGVLAGIINETTRSVSSAAAQPAASLGPRVVPTGLGIGTAAAVVIAVSSPLWAGTLFPGNTWLLVACMSLTAIAYAGHASLAGATGGQQKWNIFARLAAVEALIRLAAVGIMALAAAPLVGLEAACTAGAFVWLLFLVFSPEARLSAGARSDVPRPVLLRRMGHALVSAAATATLITGYPIMLKFTTPGAEYALAAPLILAISLTRAPIMLPLQAFQAVLINRFVNAPRNRGLRLLTQPLGLILGVGILGAALAAWLGPSIMLIFGPGYSVAPLTMAVLTFAAALMAALTLTGTIALALNRHKIYAFGWVAATVISFAALLLDLPLLERVYLSLILGPILGAAVHMAGIRRQGAPGTAASQTLKDT